MGLSIEFWGVRGSIACPSPRHMGYGGNTSCVALWAGDEHIILDAGTGIRNLGASFLAQGVERATLLLSHTHWDHINGFPFFTPIYTPSFILDIKAGHLKKSIGIKRVLSGQMSNPFFPVPLEALSAHWGIEDFIAGEEIPLSAALRVRTAPLNHPGGATGYRIEYQGRSVCYVTDHEHLPGPPDPRLLALIQGADLVIYDATYTDEEYGAKVGWGHSTWREGVALCRQAGVKGMVIFHHDPSHEDDFMDRLAAEARRAWSETVVAREGMRIDL